MPSVKLSDLMMAFDFVSSSGPYESSAYISRSTGEIYWVSDLIDVGEDLPEDLEDSNQYIEIPHKNEFDLGKRLVLRFVDRELPSSYNEVERIFSRKGAYARYKTLLERKGRLEEWYRYEEAETLSALREWSEEEGIDLIEEGDG
jgi:hypothetical protein